MTRKIRFCVTCADTRVGQHLRIVGNAPALGNWSPPNGPPLTTSAAEFPLWRTGELLALEETAPLEYKFVICDTEGRPIRWEERPNRILHLSALASSGIISKRGPVALVEGFNMSNNPEDPTRFCGVERESSSSAMNRVRRGSHQYPEREHPPTIERPDAADMFEPTMRERCPSLSMLGNVGPMNRNSSASASLSHFGNLGLTPAEQAAAPEVTVEGAAPTPTPDVQGLGGLAGVGGGSFGGGLGGLGGGEGLVREESCSNLFLQELDVTEADEESHEFEQRYSLVGQGPLGEGTFGLVWRCIPKTGAATAERAAKIVRKARLQPRDMRYLLGENGDDGEVTTHLSMKHPNVVELFEYFDEPQSVTLVLEYCRGGDLFDAIIEASKTTGRGFPENAAAVATTHVLSALAYVHGRSVVHRDVKCENVLLSKLGVPPEQNVFKLCDFGFAARDRGEGFHDRLGSPDTVAPEVVAGTRYSFPADLWSAGTLVYMMLSATPPFYAATDSDVLRKVRAGNYSLSGALWDSVSAPPKHIITSLMTVDAKLRPTAKEALQKAWLKDVPRLE